LPNIVLFPHVMQPLHIFEPRYRDMLEDALAGDRLITMALLAPGWENDYEGRPPVYSTACLGRITTHFRLEDGTYNVLLLGLHRVKLLDELEPKRRYREARVEICEDYYPASHSEQYDQLQKRLREAFIKILPILPEAQDQLDQLIESDVPLGMLADVISYMIDIKLEKKQTLLTEYDVYRRTEMLLEHLKTAASNLKARPSSSLVFPPHFSVN
jgi:Lon protease-like protein